MIDLRKYREAVKKAVKVEAEIDKNWSWRVIKVNKNLIAIGWGYLDYLHEDSAFEIIAMEDEWAEGEVNLIGTMPNGSKKYCFCGEESWSDVKTVEDGIKYLIYLMASTARSIY